MSAPLVIFFILAALAVIGAVSLILQKHPIHSALSLIVVMGSLALIYLLLVVNFQSWLDPFIILTALTGALAGVIWGLHVTSTTLSVPAMMGAIMCLGVATANSVLVVTFARTHLQEGMDSVKAAWEAGTGRLRPVIMTATAMIINGIGASAAEVANGFVSSFRDIDGSKFAGPKEPGDGASIPLIGFEGGTG